MDQGASPSESPAPDLARRPPAAQIRSYYRVLVFDTTGKEVFVYQSSRLGDAQQFIDLIEVLRLRQSGTSAG